MFCRDKSLVLLAKYGYNVVRLPRTGIEPLDVLGRDRKGVEHLGRLQAIWDSQQKVPQIQDGGVAAEIKTLTTASLKTSLGLRVLEDILSGLGASVPRLDFAYGAQRSLQFAIGNIQIAKVDPFDVGQYLKKGDLQTRNPWVGRYFLDDGTDAYVITEVLKSDTVTVIALSDATTGSELDIKAIENAIGGNIQVKVGSGKKSDITYKGPRHLTFGFKAFRISYDYDDNGVGEWDVSGVDPKKGDVYLAVTSDGGKGGKRPEGPRAPLLAERSGRVGRVDLR